MAQTKVRFDRAVEGATNIVDSGTEGTKVASGTTAQRGSTTGQWRYNTTTGFFEGRNASGTFSTLEPDPLITSISPTTQTSANANIVISGSNFFTGSTVKFIGNDGTEYASPSVTVNSVNQITATTPSTALTASNEPYDVRVTSATGKVATLANGLDAGGTPTWSTSAGNLGTIFDSATGTHFTLSASDPDGTAVVYTETASVLSGAGLSLGSANGQITGDPTDVGSSTTKTFTVNASAGGDTTARTFNIIISPSYDGSTSAKAAGSPQQIATVLGTTPSNGVYYFQNSGYNSGSPFQAYCDWSISNYNSTGIMILTQKNSIPTSSVTNFSELGTDAGSVSGTRGHGNTFTEQTNNILAGWSGDTASRAIAGMYADNGSIGSDLDDTSTLNWIEFSVTPLVFRNMFDNTPGGGEFSGTISARSVGGTGSFYWSKHGHSEYPNHLQMGNSTSNSGWNGSNYMEIRRAGGDSNHGFFVRADGNGAYSNTSNGGQFTKVGFFGFSPNNIRT